MQITSLLKRAAFALRLGDFNLLISDQITNKSRIMFVRDPVKIAEKAAPFLTFNQDPYAVVNQERAVYWIVDGYTTTNNYPYSQNANTQDVAAGQQPARQLQLRPQLGEGGHQCLHGKDDLL